MADLISGDRRLNQRYQFELSARFHSVTAAGVVHDGQGFTIDLSRRGILLMTEEPPPAGAVIDLWIDWPFLLQGVCPLELVVRGRVREVSQRGTVVENQSYEFRTRGSRSFTETFDGPSTSMIA